MTMSFRFSASAWECINGSDRFWQSVAEKLGTAHFRVSVDERVAMQEDFSGRPLASPLLPPRVTVTEHGIRYRIHFEDGHKTGFFCDQRDNRGGLARFTADKSVLDLCCYTGGFGLNALVRGKAREVTCVDLDEKAVELARENGHANQVRLDVIHADAFGYARQMGVNGKSFGVVVLDPPKLIPDREEIAPGKRKYFDLNVLAMKLVEPGGLLVTCSCSGLLDVHEFLALLGAAAQSRAARPVTLACRRGGRSSRRAFRARRELPQGRLAARGRATIRSRPKWGSIRPCSHILNREEARRRGSRGRGSGRIIRRVPARAHVVACRSPRRFDRRRDPPLARQVLDGRVLCDRVLLEMRADNTWPTTATASPSATLPWWRRLATMHYLL